MLEKLSLWIKHIILVVMFSSFADFLIPNNKFSKYIRLVLGIIIMITILNPIITLFHKENFIDSMKLEEMNTSDERNIISKAESFNQKNNEIVMENFKKNVSNIIQEQIETITSFVVKDIKIQFIEDMDNANFGKIEYIYIVLSNGKNTSKDIKVQVEKTDDENDNVLTQKENRDTEIKKIKDYLRLQFNVSFENIHINMEG